MPSPYKNFAGTISPVYYHPKNYQNPDYDEMKIIGFRYAQCEKIVSEDHDGVLSAYYKTSGKIEDPSAKIAMIFELQANENSNIFYVLVKDNLCFVPLEEEQLGPFCEYFPCLLRLDLERLQECVRFIVGKEDNNEY